MDSSAKSAASTKHVVIVGAGFAGLNCARKLASDSSAEPLMELLISYRKQWFQQTRLVLFAAAAFFSCPAMAQQTTGGQRWFDQDTMTGNWGGERTSLQDAGIDLRAHFTTESAGNPSGGNYQAVRYTQQIDFGADFDLDRLMRIHDAKIQVTLTDRVGGSLSADALGNQFAVQELYGAGQNFRLAEMNYQQDFLKHKVTIELGWSPIGDNFAGLPYFCNFQNGVICGHASAMTTDSGAHNFPTAEWGARINVSPRPDFYVATGIYQVNPNEGDSDNGFDLSFRSTGAFVPIELGWLPGQGSGRLPGVYKIGGYYNSSETPDLFKDINGQPAGLTGEPFVQHNGRWGGYIMADQMVFREESGSNRGLTLGAMVTMGDPDTAKYSYFWVAGGHYQGTFPASRQRCCLFHDRLCAHQLPADPISAGPQHRGAWLRRNPNLRKHR